MKKDKIAQQLKEIKDIVFWMDMNTKVIDASEYRKKLANIRKLLESIEEEQ